MTLDPRISEWDNPAPLGAITQECEANAGNCNILVPAGREHNSDSPSSGERTGSSPNPRGYGRAGVVGPRHCTVSSERNGLESPAIAGESPLREAAAGIADP